MSKESSVKGTGEQVKVDTNSVLQLLLAKVDHLERLATLNMVGLDQLFKFEFYQF